MSTSAEIDPFDRVVAREAELRERQDRSEQVSERRTAIRAAFGCLLAFALLFPVTWFYAKDIRWLFISHVVLLILTVACLALIWLLPESEFGKAESSATKPGEDRAGGRPRRSQLANSASSLVLFLALLPVTLYYGRHLTWLLVTHFVLIAISLGELLRDSLKLQARTRFGGSLSFLLIVGALLPVTLIYGSHITWLVITHFVLIAIALSDTVSGWLRQRETI